MSKKSVCFEASVQRLDEIVKQLERGDVPLDEALQLFQEGTGLVKSCTELLDHAELEIVKLTKGADGEPVEGTFDDDAE